MVADVEEERVDHVVIGNRVIFLRVQQQQLEYDPTVMMDGRGLGGSRSGFAGCS